VLLDGKAAIDLGKKDTLSGSETIRIGIDVAEAKTLTLEVENAEEGLVQGVVNCVEGRLVK
jgi:hypothetical protein